MNMISLVSTGMGILQALQGGSEPKHRGLHDIFHEQQILNDAAMAHAHHGCIHPPIHDTVELSGDDGGFDEPTSAVAQGWGEQAESSDAADVAEAVGATVQGLGTAVAHDSRVSTAKERWQAAEAQAASHPDPFFAIAQAERNGGGKKLTRALDAYISVLARQADAQTRMSGGVTSGLA